MTGDAGDPTPSRPAVHALVVRVAVLSGTFLALVGVVLIVVGSNQRHGSGSVLMIAGFVALGLGLVEALVSLTLLMVLRRARAASEQRPPGML
jgi:hypothetical protein